MLPLQDQTGNTSGAPIRKRGKEEMSGGRGLRGVACCDVSLENCEQKSISRPSLALSECYPPPHVHSLLSFGFIVGIVEIQFSKCGF